MKMSPFSHGLTLWSLVFTKVLAKNLVKDSQYLGSATQEAVDPHPRRLRYIPVQSKGLRLLLAKKGEKVMQ
jgi:hypothetical protein